jgi:drug/metabolite transporter (DMT)-like permease
LSDALEAGARRRAATALVFNAFVWGTSWWPLRRLQEEGVHPLWTTALTFTLASLAIAAVRPRAVLQVARTPALWLLVVAAGCTNASFNWAIVVGDVVRVVLLFYLMPLWTVLLARVVLGERLTRGAAARIALGAAGALVVLWPDASHLDAGVALPLPRSLADWLGIVGGFSFAFNNVMLRREAGRPEEGRSLAMFAGGALVAGSLATLLAAGGTIARVPAPAPAWLALGFAVTSRSSPATWRCSTARHGCRRTRPRS